MYFRKETRLPQFMPQPVFLQTMDLSINAQKLYTLLLNRTTLSQKNDWVDEEGRVYVIYTVEHMAADLGRSRRTVGRALNELEQADLIRRLRRGLKLANHIYVCMPAESSPEGLKMSHPEGTEMSSLEGSEMSHQEGSNWPTNYTDINHTEKNQLRREGAERPPRRACGHYENVFLSAEEREALDREFGAEGTAEGVERLSEYMQTTGRSYAHHGAVLRKWLREDRKKQAVPDRWSAHINYYDYEEGDVL